MKRILWVSLIFILFTGVAGLIKFWSAVVSVFIFFFPFFAEKAIDNYFTSAYFWVGVIMAVGSCFGIWFGKKGGKILYVIISIIILIISLTSIGVNVVK
jgi:hypothetical protein